MKTLNLVYPNLSDIKFHDGRGNMGKTAQFPDGQQDIVIKGSFKNNRIESFWATPGNRTPFGSNVREYYTITYPDDVVQIKSRFNSFKDLELIICATKALRKLGVKEIHLYIPYLLGARSDRQFQDGGTSYLVDVIAPIINSLGFESVTVLDVHSDVAAACINNLKVIDNTKLVKKVMDDYFNPLKTVNHCIPHEHFILISPDGGALKKIYKVADAIGYKGDIITCSKSRDEQGNLSKVKVPMGAHWNSKKDVIIIDDICDGGATFINIVKELKANGWNNNVYLIVTHGIMSRGLEELSKYFTGIYCTNSVKDISNTEFNGVKSVEYKNFVKQFCVFS